MSDEIHFLAEMQRAELLGIGFGLLAAVTWWVVGWLAKPRRGTKP